MNILMKALWIFACAVLSVQDAFISSYGMLKNNSQFLWKTTQVSRHKTPMTIILDFDFDLGNHTWDFINFTTPMQTENAIKSTEPISSNHKFLIRFEISNREEFEIDAGIYVKPADDFAH